MSRWGMWWVPALGAGMAALALGGLGPGVAAAVVAFALAWAAAWWDHRGQEQALEELASILADWSRGDFRGRIRWTKAGALGRVADQVNATGRALMEAKAQEDEVRERLQTMLGALDDGVLYLTDNRRVWTMNRAAEELFGARQEEVRGRPLLEVVPDPELDRLAEEVLATGQPARREYDPGVGEGRVLRYRLAPTRDGQGRVAGVLVVVSDRTRERRLERVRQDFLANVTHELQTPLTSIRGFAETLQGEAGEDPELRRRFLGIMEQEATRLSRMVDDLLELSRWESDRPPLAAAPFDLGDLLREVAEVVRPQMERAGLEFRLELPQGPLPLVADREAMARVVRNLVDNARKYTSEGHVVVRLFRVGAMYRLEVEDTGIGIPASSLPRVFERFYRVDKSRDRQSGGTGLGLAIVRHLVEAHGGRVRAQSEGLGLGSTFVVEIPQAPRGWAGAAQGEGQQGATPQAVPAPHER